MPLFKHHKVDLPTPALLPGQRTVPESKRQQHYFHSAVTRSNPNRTLRWCCLTHLSRSWVDRSPLCLHCGPLVTPPRYRPLRISPPGCRSIGCRQLPCRCSWLRCHTDPLCGCGSEGLQSASAPLGCCWTCGRAWGLSDSRDLWGQNAVIQTKTNRTLFTKCLKEKLLQVRCAFAYFELTRVLLAFLLTSVFLRTNGLD